ncbi:MAG: T9SS type A sorting domain-containing protein [Bacteroidales bacterium]|nr:T9SS type A sorting domain-containing protein [Bacteroidales bacterium]
MKSQSILLGLLLSLSVYAQFPEPKDFDFSCTYIMLGQQCTCGTLNGSQEIPGPTYCSYFEWNMPDTSTTTSHLDGYKVYYSKMHDSSIEVLSTLTDTSFYKLVGILGEVWVTAIYSNPAGESSKSNVIVNDNLPISLNEVEQTSSKDVIYDKYTQSITLRNIDNSQSVSIIDANGKFIRKIINCKVIDVSDLNPGLYFVVYSDIELKTSSDKFIKK